MCVTSQATKKTHDWTAGLIGPFGITPRTVLEFRKRRTDLASKKRLVAGRMSSRVAFASIFALEKGVG
jgi:hypothetical protein